MLLSYSTSQSQFSVSPLLPTLYLSSPPNSLPHPSEKSGPLRDNYQTWQNEIQGKAKSLHLRQTRQPNRRGKVSKAKKSETHLLQLFAVSQKYQAINHKHINRKQAYTIAGIVLATSEVSVNPYKPWLFDSVTHVLLMIFIYLIHISISCEV